MVNRSAANADKSKMDDPAQDSASRIRPAVENSFGEMDPLRLLQGRVCRVSTCGSALESVAQRMASLPGAQRRETALALQRTRGNRFVQRMAAQAKREPNRTGMPDALKAGIESLSGIDMSDVRVHANSDKSARLDALAYTQGNQIYLGPGQERHLPHEAWHAVQQMEGRVKATRQMKELLLNDDQQLEREANVMSLRATQLEPLLGSTLSTLPDGRSQQAPIQCCFYCGDPACAGKPCKKGLGASFAGLLTPGTAPRAAGPHSQTQKDSQRGVFESEHMLPGAALRKSGVQHKLQAEPTYSVEYGVHRGAVSGAGGGISSTGSSATATQWSAHLGQMIATQGQGWPAAIKAAAIDAFNASLVTKALNDERISQILQVIRGHQELGRITNDEQADISTVIMNMWLNYQGNK